MKLYDRLRFATMAGIVAGVVALVVGLARALIVIAAGREVALDVRPSQLLLYVGGWTGTCVVGAVIWPITRIPGGGVLVGLVGAAFLVGSVIAIAGGAPWADGIIDGWLLLTALFGGFVGFLIERDRRRAI